MAGIINNQNLKELIGYYVYSPNHLPEELRGIAINDWDVTGVTNMHGAFDEMEDFNEPINRWTVSQVTNMAFMFFDCENFNQDLSDWDVSHVTDMTYMFNSCKSFDSRLDWGEKVRNVDRMDNMFRNCRSLGQSGVSNGLEGWITDSLQTTTSMFLGCVNFNENIGGWNVSHVLNMNYMFYGCTSFNQDLNRWDVSNVWGMIHLFYNCTSFNGPINNWQIKNDAITTDMFLGCNIELDNQPPLIAEPLLRKRRNKENAMNVSLVAQKGNTYIPTDVEKNIQSFVVEPKPTGGRKSRKNKNKKKSRKNNKRKSRRHRK